MGTKRIFNGTVQADKYLKGSFSRIAAFCVGLAITAAAQASICAQTVQKAPAASESTKIVKLPGTVKGTITVKQISGNNLGGFGCSNVAVWMTATAGGSKKWQLQASGTGKISSGKCTFVLNNVRPDEEWILALTPKFPKTCDQKIFKPDAAFPASVKPGRVFIYNLTIHDIRCDSAL